MKTPLTAIITGALLWFLYLFFGRQIDLAFCAIILFGTGIVAWTVEQYGHHRPH
ncbi:hypothetical protein Verru16b_03303 [Lacunisphaera limnophila]|jgi:hypothetical protein|uniref:Uncharacterized protein n=1 Tax=Lacunisphaera limnophila TaxID=1838286 RepID=A0A1D8AZ85_9BACT|nr:hypothetical protein [Lacunisphaera limnophila]AOS46206.1 hypothetical protein Verru16b_03303 [Lacunisphaera limnophila]